MRLERGDRVIFTENAGGILGPFVRKGTEGTVTKAGWGPSVEVTLENGTKLTVSKDKVRKIGRKSSWW
jgi:preprotein translocase subunit YajC